MDIPRSVIIEPGAELLRCWEGIHDGDKTTPEWEPKLCPTGRWTVGWGHVLVHENRQLEGQKDRDQAMKVYRQRWPNGLMREHADSLLLSDLSKISVVVDSAVTEFIAEYTHAALVVFAYNIGTNGFLSSSTLRFLNNRQRISAANAMLSWNKGRLTRGAPKVEIPGLTYRRHSERALFLGRVKTVTQVRNMVAELQDPKRRDKMVEKLTSLTMGGEIGS